VTHVRLVVFRGRLVAFRGKLVAWLVAFRGKLVAWLVAFRGRLVVAHSRPQVSRGIPEALAAGIRWLAVSPLGWTELRLLEPGEPVARPTPMMGDRQHLNDPGGFAKDEGVRELLESEPADVGRAFERVPVRSSAEDLESFFDLS
jgi:hypothetical protein